MKKQELIHLHGLLAQVQSHYEENKGGKVETPRYARTEATPTSIHRDRAEHRDSVMALAADISEQLTEKTDLQSV